MSYWPESMSWETMPLKFVCKMNPQTLSEKTNPAMEIEYIDISSVSLEEGVKDRQLLLFGEAPSRARKKIYVNDTIISTVRTYLKAIAYIDQNQKNLVASTGFAVLRPTDKILPKFLYRVIQSNPFIEEVVSKSNGVSYPAINPSVLGRIEVPLPPIAFQQEAVEFLDKEVQDIDNLVSHVGGYEAAHEAKPGSFLALLLEKRAALITSVITGEYEISKKQKEAMAS